MLAMKMLQLQLLPLRRSLLRLGLDQLVRGAAGRRHADNSQSRGFVSISWDSRLLARRSNRDICYGDVAGWVSGGLAGWMDGWLTVTAGIVSKRLPVCLS